MTEETVQTEQVKNDAQQQPEIGAGAEQQAAPDLNINDLAAMRNLIEVVTQRGAFKATELSAAGMLFDKLNAFLNAIPKNPETEQGVK